MQLQYDNTTKQIKNGDATLGISIIVPGKFRQPTSVIANDILKFKDKQEAEAFMNTFTKWTHGHYVGPKLVVADGIDYSESISKLSREVDTLKGELENAWAIINTSKKKRVEHHTLTVSKHTLQKNLDACKLELAKSMSSASHYKKLLSQAISTAERAQSSYHSLEGRYNSLSVSLNTTDKKYKELKEKYTFLLRHGHEKVEYKNVPQDDVREVWKHTDDTHTLVMLSIQARREGYMDVHDAIMDKVQHIHEQMEDEVPKKFVWKLKN